MNKIATAPTSKVFSFLDRGGALTSVGPSAKQAVTGKPPSLGSFGVRSVGAGIAKKADDACGGVTNADLKTTQEEYRAPIARKKSAETMDEAAWKQTLKDIPLVILATGLGYGVGKTISGHLGQTLAQNGTKPAWTKHIPAATALLSSLGSYAMGRSRNELERRRQEARERAGSPSDQVGEKLSHEFSLFVGGKLAGGS